MASVVGPRQKRRKVQAALKNIELCLEAEYSISGVRSSVSSQEEEDNRLPETALSEEIDESTDVESSGYFITNKLITAGDFQCQMEFSETITVSEYDYESDAEPLDSSCDE